MARKRPIKNIDFFNHEQDESSIMKLQTTNEPFLQSYFALLSHLGDAEEQRRFFNFYLSTGKIDLSLFNIDLSNFSSFEDDEED